MEMTIRGNYLSTKNFFIDEPSINIELDAFDLNTIIQTCLDRIISDECDCCECEDCDCDCCECNCDCDHEEKPKVAANAAIWRFDKGDGEWKSIFDNTGINLRDVVLQDFSDLLRKKEDDKIKRTMKEKSIEDQFKDLKQYVEDYWSHHSFDEAYEKNNILKDTRFIDNILNKLANASSDKKRK